MCKPSLYPSVLFCFVVFVFFYIMLILISYTEARVWGIANVMLGTLV